MNDSNALFLCYLQAFRDFIVNILLTTLSNFYHRDSVMDKYIFVEKKNKKLTMKKTMLSAFAVLSILASCSDDDDAVAVVQPDDQGEVANVVLNEVQYRGTDQIEILNKGQEAADLNDFWLCLGPGNYQRIGDLTPISGNTTVPAGGFVVLPMSLPDTEGGIGLYATNEFTNADAIVDFVQYGAAGSPRESVAVAAGLWTAGEFVPEVTSDNHSIIFDGDGNGAANWAETTTPTFGAANMLMAPVRSVVFNEVNYGENKLIELYNKGNVTVDLDPYWLCLGPGQYIQIENITPESGNKQLAPGEFLVLNWNELGDSEGLGLYSNNSFGSSDAIIDFVQWGASGSARENVAVGAGIWTAGEYVPNVALGSYSIAYDGEGDSASDWEQDETPTFGSENSATDNLTTFVVTIKNEINYLATHVFNTPDGASSPGPLTTTGASYSIPFKAQPGAKLSFATMSAMTNDWFFAPNGEGVTLFDSSNQPITGDITSQIYLWDGGTEEEDPSTIATEPDGMTAGDPDDDNTVRIQTLDVSSYASFEIEWDAANSQFILKITRTDMGIITPGLVVLHAQDNPLFTEGEPDRGVGLERIGEAGVPTELYNWFNETGSQGAPLRLATAISVLSPGLVYAFNTNQDPWFTQGEDARPASGVEEVAEDGNNQVAIDYLEGLGLPVVGSDQTAPVGPGESLTFTIQVPQGQEYKLGFGTMVVQTNDWFISYNNNGVALFDADGVPFSGMSSSSQTYLFDAGTEEDEAVGFGMYQAPRQSGPNMGPADSNTTIRRVGSIEDVQFGKGVINSAPGVTWLGDPRGGYNFVSIDVQPQ